MSKKLENLSLKELYNLFPIIFSEPDTEWQKMYEEESRRIINILPSGQIRRISHIGSTAIGGILAKPIVDILVEAPLDAIALFADRLKREGYIIMSAGDRRVSLNKGYTLHGYADEVFHIHIVRAGDNDELYFRDYLMEHPAAAKRYEALKLSLKATCGGDREVYTAGKTDFVKFYTFLARNLYRGRY